MARIGSKQKSKGPTIEDLQDLARRQHLKWDELEHISEEFKQAMHKAHAPFIAEFGQKTQRMQEIWYRYAAWCVRYYGKKA